MNYSNHAIKDYIDFLRTVIFCTGKWESTDSAWHLSYWRKILFITCCLANYQEMTKYLDFFTKDKQRLAIITNQTSLYEQTTRQWLYYKSTTDERGAAAIAHFSFLQGKLTTEALFHIYIEKGITLWSQPFNEDILTLKLNYERFYRKEGLLAVSLNLGDSRLYSVSFWVAPDSKSMLALWIGTLQGAKGQATLIHALTKHFFGYRPKNLMIHVIRLLACRLQLNTIYAVSNYGSYVNTRFAINRKLKTSLDEFWTELGGKISEDPRFFLITPEETRKSFEELPSHKRNLYRKRFVLLDKIDEAANNAMNGILRKVSG